MIWIYFITHFDPYIIPYNFLQLLCYYLICQKDFENTRPTLAKTFWLLFQAINLLAQDHFCDQFKIDKKVLYNMQNYWQNWIDRRLFPFNLYFSSIIIQWPKSIHILTLLSWFNITKWGPLERSVYNIYSIYFYNYSIIKCVQF